MYMDTVISVNDWLYQVVRLFTHAVDAVLAVPVLAFFLDVLLFVVIVCVFARIVHQGKKGGL